MARFPDPDGAGPGRATYPDWVARVYAAPHDWRLRKKVGEVLCAGQNPHGELIRLQHTPSTPTRDAQIKALITHHSGALLAPFRGVLWPKKTVFCEGFVDVVHLRPRAVGHPVLTDPVWRTVREIFLPTNVNESLVHALAGEAFISLRVLHRLPGYLLRCLVHTELPDRLDQINLNSNVKPLVMFPAERPSPDRTPPPPSPRYPPFRR